MAGNRDLQASLPGMLLISALVTTITGFALLTIGNIFTPFLAASLSFLAVVIVLMSAFVISARQRVSQINAGAATIRALAGNDFVQSAMEEARELRNQQNRDGAGQEDLVDE